MWVLGTRVAVITGGKIYSWDYMLTSLEIKVRIEGEK